MEHVRFIIPSSGEKINFRENYKVFNDYNSLINLPSINNITLKGNNSFESLGLNKYPFYGITNNDIKRWNNGYDDTLIKQRITTNEQNIANINNDIEEIDQDIIDINININNLDSKIGDIDLLLQDINTGNGV